MSWSPGVPHGGNSAFFGGGIYNAGLLTLSNSAVSANSASFGGGGVFAGIGGTATLTASTISANSAAPRPSPRRGPLFPYSPIPLASNPHGCLYRRAGHPACKTPIHEPPLRRPRGPQAQAPLEAAPLPRPDARGPLVGLGVVNARDPPSRGGGCVFQARPARVLRVRVSLIPSFPQWAGQKSVCLKGQSDSHVPSVEPLN